MSCVLYENYKATCPRLPAKIVYEIDPSTNCWNCTSHSFNYAGYPKIQRYNKVLTITKYVYSLFVSEVPKDKVVYTSCNNLRCINPEHLFLSDKIRKKAISLSEKDKVEIRASDLSNYRLACIFKTTKKTIINVRCFLDV